MRGNSSYLGSATWRYWAVLSTLVIALVVVLLFAADSRGRLLGWNTLQLAFAVCLFSIPPGCVLAWVVFCTNTPVRRVATMLLVLMLFMPLYLQAAGWDAGLGQQGWLQIGFRSFSSVPLLSGWRGAVFVHAVAALPWVFVIVGAGLLRVPASVEEAASLDAGPFHNLRRVTLPLAWPAIVIASLWTVIVVAGEMTVTDIFQVRTYCEELYIGYALDTPTVLGTPASSVGVWPGIGLTMLLAALAILVCAGVLTCDLPLSLRPPLRIDVGRARWLAAALLVVTLVVVAGVPLANLVFKAGVVVEQVGGERVRTWSLAKVARFVAVSPWKFRQEIIWSLVIGNLASITSVVAAIGLAWWAQHRRVGHAVLLLLTAICLALPGPVIGLGLIRLLNQRDIAWLTFLYDRTVLAPWLALSIRCFPIVLLLVWLALRSVPRAAIEAAAADGAGGRAILFRIVLPLRMPAFIASWVLGLAVAMGDLAMSVLVVPPGVTTLAIRIFGLVHYGVEDQLAALCLFTTAVIAGLICVSAALLLRLTRQI